MHLSVNNNIVNLTLIIFYELLFQIESAQAEKEQKISRVDFVLAYVDNNNQNHAHRRELFEESLLDQGLELEYEQNRQLCFVKVCAPKV